MQPDVVRCCFPAKKTLAWRRWKQMLRVAPSSLIDAAAPVIWQNEVHVWRARLDVPWSWTFDEALSLDDRARADRFKFESDRRHFCVGRASLRLILSRYLQTKPGRLQFETGEFGKPFFADKKLSGGLHFNLSHSNQLALI